jgi:hypothetical protein
MSLKKRNRRVQLKLGQDDLFRRHAEAYLAGERSWWITSRGARKMARRIQRERAAAR